MYGVFPFAVGKGSETSSCGGEKGLRLPRSLGRSMRKEGVSDPFPHRKRESQTLFPTAKGETSYIPKTPQRKSPQRNASLWKRGKVRVGFWIFRGFLFLGCRIFSRIWCRRISSPHFCGKKCPEKSSRKIPGKILQKLYSKNPRHTFLQRGQAKKRPPGPPPPHVQVH